MNLKSHLQHARAKLAGLPLWLKVLLSIQGLAPGVALWFQMKYVAIKSMQVLKFVDLTKFADKLSDEQRMQFVRLLGDYVQEGLPGKEALQALASMNGALGILGALLVILMWWPAGKMRGGNVARGADVPGNAVAGVK